VRTDLATNQPTIVLVDAAGAYDAIPGDLPCARCGYNLRGLAAAAACPECGLGVDRSTAGAEAALAELPPAWVARVARGAALVASAYVLPVFIVPLNRTGFLDPERVRYGRLLTLLALAAVHAAGAFLITLREPRWRDAFGDAGPRFARRALRACALTPVVAVAAFWVSILRGVGWDETVVLAICAVTIVCPALTMLRLQQLTRRVGRPRVAEYGAIAGCGLSGAIAVSACVAAPAAWLSYPEWAVMTTAGCVIAAGVFYVWCTWMLLMIARALRAAAKQARAAWRAADRAR
jgi:hypothetical protein